MWSAAQPSARAIFSMARISIDGDVCEYGGGEEEGEAEGRYRSFYDGSILRDGGEEARWGCRGGRRSLFLTYDLDPGEGTELMHAAMDVGRN